MKLTKNTIKQIIREELNVIVLHKWWVAKGITMKLTKTRLKQIIREELNEEFRIPYMGRHRKSQIGGENIRKWTGW